MVKLINDDDIEMRGVQVSQSGCSQTLDGREDRFELLGPLATHPQIAKQRISQRLLKGGPALGENLFSVGDEQQSGARQSFAQGQVVKGRHDRLSSARCCDKKISVMSLLAGKRDLLKQPLLERFRAQLCGAQQKS